MRVSSPRTGLHALSGLGGLWPRKHRKHRTCRAFSTSAPRKHRPCRTLATWALERGLLGAPGALEWAARAPSRCPLGARRCCSRPHSVAPERSQGLLEPPFGAPERSKGLLQPPLGAPGVLEGAAQACSVPHVRALRHFAPLLAQRVLELPPGSLSARDDVRECCAKNLC